MKQAAKAQAEKTRASEEERRVKESRTWSTRICRWLQEQNLDWAHQEKILDLTRRELDQAEHTEILPRLVAPKGMPLDEIIKRTRPMKEENDLSLNQRSQNWAGENAAFPKTRAGSRLLTCFSLLNGWVYGPSRRSEIESSRTPHFGDALLRTKQMEVIRPKRASGNFAHVS
jgi:hypothetical protein